ncbi:hypothetical protein O3M35_012632 [Rhynocoris fuscipes]|uniref:Uncharacterized protein n=1 Tax=Rhynocoris fuscipes TaxID=488301 RepID=A0AAW1CUI1_9HEMI
MYVHLVLLSAATSFISAATLSDPDLHNDNNFNSINHQQQFNQDPIKQIIENECHESFTPFCIKLNLMNIIGHSRIAGLQILPGVTLSSSGLPPLTTSVQSLMKQPNMVDNVLFERISDYIGTLSLNVRILNNNNGSEDNAVNTGRGKKNGGGAIIAAGLMSAATVLAVSLAGLAAISGKALMAALMALMLAGIAALNKGGDDHKTTYEIVAKPVVSHSHTHTSEVQHGHHGHYKRSLDAHQMAYSSQKPH